MISNGLRGKGYKGFDEIPFRNFVQRRDCFSLKNLIPAVTFRAANKSYTHEGVGFQM